MRKISISLVLALCISMLLGSVVFAQNTAVLLMSVLMMLP